MVEKERDNKGVSDSMRAECVPDFFRNYYPMFVSFARNFVQNHETCEDLVQESFVAMLEQGHTFENEYLAKGFLYKTIRNRFRRSRTKTVNPKRGFFRRYVLLFCFFHEITVSFPKHKTSKICMKRSIQPGAVLSVPADDIYSYSLSTAPIKS